MLKMGSEAERRENEATCSSMWQETSSQSWFGTVRQQRLQHTCSKSKG